MAIGLTSPLDFGKAMSREDEKVCLSVCLSVSLQSVHVSICVSISVSISVSICVSVCLQGSPVSDLQASHWLFFHSLVQERLRGLENRNHILTEGTDN